MTFPSQYDPLLQIDPPRVDLYINQGSRYQLNIRPVVSWLTVLTGYTAKGQVKDSRTLPGAVLLVDFTAYLTVDVPNNLVKVDIPANITAAWDWDLGEYDMKLVEAGQPGHDVRFIQGYIRVNKEVTDS